MAVDSRTESRYLQLNTKGTDHATNPLVFSVKETLGFFNVLTRRSYGHPKPVRIYP